MPNDLRWSLWNNNRNKVHSKCNALESSRNRRPCPACPYGCLVAQSCPTLCDHMDAALQASLSFTTSKSLLELISIESVMPSKHLILCCPLLLLPSILPSIRVFSNELFASCGQSIGASSSASVLPVNIQGQFPLGLTSLISLQSKGFSRVFSNTTV